MTYVELFDQTALENVCSSLAQKPDKVIFLGDNSKAMKKSIEIYSEIFNNEIKFEYISVNGNDLSNIVEELIKIVENDEQCYFDVTGGSDLYLVAMGIVAERYKNSNVQIHRFNIQSRKIYDCDGDGKNIFDEDGKNFSNEFPTLSVNDNAKIYGGRVKSTDTPKNDDHYNDVNSLWNICKRDPGKWNLLIKSFSALFSEKELCNDNLSYTFTLNFNKFINKSIAYLFKNLSNRELINGFEYIEDSQIISFTFKDVFIKKCLTVSGKVFELKIYYLAKNATKNGVNVFTDVQTSVELKWDKILSNPYTETFNEIDVFAMDNLIPVFISCKNGQVTTEELYKLNSVANKFGKKYSKKVLVVNEIFKYNDKGKKINNPEYQKMIRNRAKDMNIVLIENCYLASEKKLANALANYSSSIKFKPLKSKA